ncbi:hypothetical protein P167DRAFT_275238 [Morchella conica CCBAS932]|uniref:Uncharacterized protein n=1 Tax=Morchella conica CCBAS932 TaxID=1392247 RepID=A0A3N4KHS6_9PEZI|nr:hypothetical protein P167DRAFT_275238 [Morchella conica CCBAS932]
MDGPDNKTGRGAALRTYSTLSPHPVRHYILYSNLPLHSRGREYRERSLKGRKGSCTSNFPYSMYSLARSLCIPVQRNEPLSSWHHALSTRTVNRSPTSTCTIVTNPPPPFGPPSHFSPLLATPSHLEANPLPPPIKPASSTKYRQQRYATAAG